MLRTLMQSVIYEIRLSNATNYEDLFELQENMKKTQKREIDMS